MRRMVPIRRARERQHEQDERVLRVEVVGRDHTVPMELAAREDASLCEATGRRSAFAGWIQAHQTEAENFLSFRWTLQKGRRRFIAAKPPITVIKALLRGRGQRVYHD